MKAVIYTGKGYAQAKIHDREEEARRDVHKIVITF